MKITRQKEEFIPIDIRIENNEELTAIIDVLQWHLEYLRLKPRRTTKAQNFFKVLTDVYTELSRY